MRQFASTNVDRLSRRDFLKVAGGLGLSAAGLTLLEACGVKPTTPILEDAPLETTAIRLIQTPSICLAPLYVAEDLLKEEGFTDVQYVKLTTVSTNKVISSGQADMGGHFSGPVMIGLDAGDPLLILSGMHVGCFVLFGAEGVNTILDLKGKNVAITEIGGSEHVFISSMAAYVGLNPNKDINWITHPVPESKQLFSDGKLDAFLAFPPVVQELEAKKIGHVVVNSMMDDPWSQYYCCMAIANRDFVQNNPVATKHALRAILKATDLCARDPQRAAKLVVDMGFPTNYDYALKAMQEIPYNVWRDYDPEDTLRFYALRLRDAGMIKSNPDEIIAQGTNWTFLNELKTELKG
jgi:NitT/TauT family transport system substrate-binding protein